jgi:tetratricopeptide (TPR) repeat protein/DNA-binding XRE family transcriptional regulator
MASKTPSDINLALACMRSALNWKQSELAEAARTRGTTISDFERGNRTFSLEKLTELAGVLGLTPEAAAQARAFVRSMEEQARPPGHHGPDAAEDRRRIERVAAQAGTLASDFTRSVLSFVSLEARSVAAREEARLLWLKMRRLSPSQRRDLVEKDPRFRSWALCELVCKESIKAAADNADRARELADLALRIADLAPGAASWRQRLQGYAWAHVGNARRVGGDLPGAEKAFGRAGKLWEMGEEGDPGILDEAQVLSLEASLRTTQGRLSEAEVLLDRALTSASTEVRPNLLLQKARLLEWTGDYEGALVTLGEAAPIVPLLGDLRMLCVLRHNSAINLSQLGRYSEAEKFLPEVRALTAQLGNELDFLRLHWLEARIAAGLGKKDEASVALAHVRAQFAERGISYDTALVTLELTVLYLEQGRTREVKALARQMAPIFQVQGVHREALAALKLFCEAVEKESVTVELARRIVNYLYRAQHNPSLRFEPFP